MTSDQILNQIQDEIRKLVKREIDLQKEIELVRVKRESIYSLILVLKHVPTDEVSVGTVTTRE